MKARQIAPLALILLGAVGCTSGGAGGGTSSTPESSVGVSTTALSSPAPSSSAAVTSPSPTPMVATTGPNVRPGEKPPTLTAGAKTNTRSGALQFSIVWVRALDWGYATTDSTLTRMMFTADCAQCERFAEIFDSAKAASDHFKGGRLSYMSSTLISDATHPGTQAVDVVFGQQPVTRVSASGKPIHESPGHASTTYRLWALWQAGTWKVIDLKQVVYK